jgi:4-amino-4-deoxy-L-arabinose transferase-like glycosyltransferase
LDSSVFRGIRVFGRAGSFSFRQIDIFFLLALVIAGYGFRLATLSIRGEESRWATVAMEMERSGDWVVPRQQGEPFLSRPPMGSWLIGLSASLCGGYEPFAVRLPSLLAVLITTLVIHSYASSFLGRTGALASAVGFAVMPEIMQMGRLAESDIVFTMFLGSAFLTWHWGQARKSRLAWVVSYLLVAAATLTKGPQAPVYFGLTVGIYLISIGQWRMLLSWTHAWAILAYMAAVGVWVVPFCGEMGLAQTWKIIMGDSTDRFHGLSPSDIVEHLVRYPVEVVGCTAPWSYLSLAFFSRSFRRSLGDAGPLARFMLIALAVSFPTCWITPGGQTRYMMPLYPCVAILGGIVVDRFVAAPPWLRHSFAGIRGLTIAAMGCCAIMLAALTWFVDDSRIDHWRQPSWYVVAFGGVTAIAMRVVGTMGPIGVGRARPIGIGALGAFMVMLYNGAIVNQLSATSEHAREAVARLKSRLPDDATMSSFGPIHHKFAYEFGRPIRLMSERETETGEWFCYTSVGGKRRPLPFAFEEVASISMDRHYSPNPMVEVVVCRRLDTNRIGGPTVAIHR